MTHIKSLKVFCDVVARRSFSRAASDNGISQSGASQIVHQLEEQLGVRLIDRSKRPFVLTPEGKIYYDGCRRLIQAFTALEEEVRTFHEDVAGRVGVASIYSVGLSHMNQFVQQFLSQHPKANVRIEYQHPDRVYELVTTDQVDLGLVSFPKSNRTIRAIPWREERMVLVCAPTHEWAERTSVRLSELSGRKMVGFDDNLMIRHEVDRVLSSRGIEVDVVMEFDNIETLKRAVEIDSGFSLLPAPTIERELEAGTLAAIPMEDVEMTRPVGIIQRRGAQWGKTAIRFVEMLRAAADPVGERPGSSRRRAAASRSRDAGGASGSASTPGAAVAEDVTRAV